MMSKEASKGGEQTGIRRRIQIGFSTVYRRILSLHWWQGLLLAWGLLVTLDLSVIWVQAIFFIGTSTAYQLSEDVTLAWIEETVFLIVSILIVKGLAALFRARRGTV